MLNRCVPYTDSANTETDLCAYPKCDAAEVVALGGVCDTALGKGEWAMSTRAQKAACLVKVTKVEGEVYKMQASDDIAGASDALLEYIAQAAGFLNDLVSSLQASWLPPPYTRNCLLVSASFAPPPPPRTPAGDLHLPRGLWHPSARGALVCLRPLPALLCRRGAAGSKRRLLRVSTAPLMPPWTV